MSQEAKAVSRKATGNWTDRAGTPEIPTSKEGRRGTGAPLIVMMNIGERRCKIDTLCECNRSLPGAIQFLPVDHQDQWTWEPCAVKVACTVLRGGECREAPTYPARGTPRPRRVTP
jgi:hypothetical protein